jgi:hypothetical protein
MLQRRRLCALALCALMLLSTSPAAYAWKPSTHLYLAQVALEDALDDGKVTIHRVNYETGERLGILGEYKVDRLTLQALRENRAQFLAGVLGPDVYPDILTGQGAIHPFREDSIYRPRPGQPDKSEGSDAWLRYIWDRAEGLNPAASLPVRAFTIGFLTHGAGDSYAHTFVNHFAGGPFEPGENAIKHIVLEGYIGKRAPGRGRYTISAEGVRGFILDTLVRAEPDSHLWQLLGGSSTQPLISRETFLQLAYVPLTFSRLRASLALSLQPEERDAPSRSTEDRKEVRGWAGTWDNFKREWIVLIDKGLEDWVVLSESIGEALFNSEREGGRADFKRAKQLIEEYNKKHMRKMLYGPLGKKVDDVERRLVEFVPAPVREAVKSMRDKISHAWYEIFKFFFRLFTRKDFEELQKYYTDPENYVERVLNPKGATKGEKISHRELDRLLGVTHRDDETKDKETRGKDNFDYRTFAPAYNTVLLTKLLLLDKDEMNRLLQDLGATAGPGAGAATMTQSNIMLGFNKSLDDSNQWAQNEGYRMALVHNVVYDQIFKKQVGESSGIDFYLAAKAVLYNLIPSREAKTPTQQKGAGRAQFYEQGRVYWSPGNGVRVVQGDILAKWNALGSEGGSLGFPVSDPQQPGGEHGGDWYQFFEHGVIYRHAAQNRALVFLKRSDRSVETEDAATSIRRKAESSGLGNPHTLTPTPQQLPSSTAWWQRFERGYVYWSAEGGAKWLSEPVWDLWIGSATQLGPPVTDELAAQDGDANDRAQFFANGIIYRRTDSNLLRLAYLRPIVRVP